MPHRYWFVTNDLFEPRPRCSCPLASGWRILGYGLTLKIRRYLSRQAGDGEIVFGKSDRQLLVALHFPVYLHFVFDYRHVEMPGEKSIGLLAVVEFIVVRARVHVLIERNVFFLPIEFEEGLDFVIQVRLLQGGSQAILVLGP